VNLEALEDKLFGYVKTIAKHLPSLFVVFALLFSLLPVTAIGKAEAQSYFVIDDSIVTSTSTGEIVVTPHTLTASGWVTVEFKSKSDLLLGDVDVAVGFNGYDEIGTAKSQYYADGNWNCSTSKLSNVACNFSGANVWESVKCDYKTVKGTWNKVRFWVDVPVRFRDNPLEGKYNVLIKPSSISLQSAISSGLYVLSDPWYNVSWDYRKTITVSDAVAGYQTFILVGKTSAAIGEDTDCSGHVQDDFDDLRFTEDDEVTLVDHWVESVVDSGGTKLATVWVQNSSDPDNTLYMYYGNAGASAPDTNHNMGVATFGTYEDFEWSGGGDGDPLTDDGGSVDWSVSIAGGTSVAELDNADDIGDETGYFGSLAGRLYYDGSNIVEATFSKSAAEDYAIRFRWYKDDSILFMFRHGNGTYNIRLRHYYADENIYYYDGAWNDTGQTINADEWHLLEVNDIDWTNATYDIYLDGARIVDDVDMQTTSDYTDEVCFITTYGSNEANFDNVIIRKWASTEQTFAFGAETPQPDVDVDTLAATNKEDTTATLNGEIIDDDGETMQYYGFVWGTSDEGDPGDVDPSTPAGTWSNGWKSSLGDYGKNTFAHAVSGLPTGTTIYFRAAAKGDITGWVYGDALSFLTKPAAPTNVAATDGTDTQKVVVTWTKSTGATGYRVYRGGADVSGLLGDVATHDDTGADAPTITPGTATASDGTSASHVTLSLAGESASNGATANYLVVASNATGSSDNSTSDNGYRGTTSLTYQWQRSAADADTGYGNIAGGTTDPYNDTGGVAHPDGRYYKCVVSMTGAANQTSSSDRGYMGIAPTVTTGLSTGAGSDWGIVTGSISALGFPASVTQIGIDYGTDGSYGSDETESGAYSTGAEYSITLNDLTAATVIHYRFKAYNSSGWGYGADRTFSTTGSASQYEYMNTGCSENSSAIYGNTWAYQQFTVGDISHTVTSINLYIKRVGDPGTCTVSLRHGAAGKPTGNDLVSTTFDGDAISTSYQMYSFAVSEISIESASQYAVVVRAVDGDSSNYIQWCIDSDGGLADAVGGYSTNGGLSFADDSPSDFLFEIWGYSCIRIESARVFQSYKQSGDYLIVADTTNVYVPYYPNGDPQLQFQLQLIDDSSVIRGTTNFKMWERQPLAIYLNASSTSALSWGSLYTLRIQALFANDVKFDYSLSSDEWIAGDLLYLDSYVKSLASAYETYYDETLLTSQVGGTDIVLNEAGSVIFMRGIPGLEEIRPNLFYGFFGIDEPEDAEHDIYTPHTASALGADIYARIQGFNEVIGDPSVENSVGWALTGLALFAAIACVGAGFGVVGIIVGAFFAGGAGLIFGGVPIALVGAVGFAFVVLIGLWLRRMLFPAG